MAGYIIALNNEAALDECIKKGIYSTNLSEPKNNKWRIPHEGTFADFLGMKKGDNIYFFIKRKIYGLGEIINIKHNCKYLNYENADIPKNFTYDEVKKSMLLDEADNLNNRCMCIFKPSPNFFKNGIDMDDALASNPNKFRMLRAFWKLSFIKIDDEENKALKDVILKNNEENIYSTDEEQCFKFDNSFHKKIENKLTEKHLLTPNNILKYCEDSKNGLALKHEMAIESALIDILSNNKENLFGEWSYISHQVIASPFKPIDYMDKMDVFGYRYIPGFNTISKYLVIEIKKDEATHDVINQIMKYVDWVNQEYTHGDYSMINAFIVAYDFSNEVIEYRNKICIRNYIKGRRPAISANWNSVKLIKYRFENNNISFEEV